MHACITVTILHVYMQTYSMHACMHVLYLGLGVEDESAVESSCHLFDKLFAYTVLKQLF